MIKWAKSPISWGSSWIIITNVLINPIWRLTLYAAPIAMPSVKLCKKSPIKKGIAECSSSSSSLFSAFSTCFLTCSLANSFFSDFPSSFSLLSDLWLSSLDFPSLYSTCFLFLCSFLLVCPWWPWLWLCPWSCFLCNFMNKNSKNRKRTIPPMIKRGTFKSPWLCPSPSSPWWWSWSCSCSSWWSWLWSCPCSSWWWASLL